MLLPVQLHRPTGGQWPAGAQTGEKWEPEEELVPEMAPIQERLVAAMVPICGQNREARVQSRENQRLIDKSINRPLINRSHACIKTWKWSTETDESSIIGWLKNYILVRVLPTVDLVERFFSAGGYALNDLRERLLPAILELQLFLKGEHKFLAQKDGSSRYQC